MKSLLFYREKRVARMDLATPHPIFSQNLDTQDDILYREFKFFGQHSR